MTIVTLGLDPEGVVALEKLPVAVVEVVVVVVDVVVTLFMIDDFIGLRIFRVLLDCCLKKYLAE